MLEHYADFKKELTKELSRALEPEGIHVRETVMYKTNGEREGMELQIPGHNVSPVVYPAELYESYRNGHPLSEIVARVKEQAEQALSLPEQMSFDRRYLAEHIYPVVINAERNEELLSRTPHERYHDLAIVPRCLVDGMNEEHCSFYVTNSYVQSLHMSPNECMDLAMERMREMKYTATPLEEIIRLVEEKCGMTEGEKPANVPSLYVLSNPAKAYGAAAMLDRQLLADTARQMEAERIFVLPSSVHEVICAPVPPNADAMTVRQMENMVYTINRTEVPPSDFLSDSVYLFNRMDLSFQIATAENICPAPQKEAFSMTMRR